MSQNYLKQIIDERRLTYTEIAKAVGVTKAAVAYWAKGNLPQGENLAALCDFLKVEPSYLQYGIAGKPGGSVEISDDMVSIPVLDIQGACGINGRINLLTHMVNMIQVAKSWILARCVAPNFQSLHIINAYGDSMKPLINDGDFVIVDTSKRELLGDGVYVLQAGGDTFIKRIQKQINGSLLLISDNPAYRPYEITKDEIDTVQVIGKAIIACNAKEI